MTFGTDVERRRASLSLCTSQKTTRAGCPSEGSSRAAKSMRGALSPLWRAGRAISRSMTFGERSRSASMCFFSSLAWPAASAIHESSMAEPPHSSQTPSAFRPWDGPIRRYF